LEKAKPRSVSPRSPDARKYEGKPSTDTKVLRNTSNLRDDQLHAKQTKPKFNRTNPIPTFSYLGHDDVDADDLPAPEELLATISTTKQARRNDGSEATSSQHFDYVSNSSPLANNSQRVNKPLYPYTPKRRVSPLSGSQETSPPRKRTKLAYPSPNSSSYARGAPHSNLKPEFESFGRSASKPSRLPMPAREIEPRRKPLFLSSSDDREPERTLIEKEGSQQPPNADMDLNYELDPQYFDLGPSPPRSPAPGPTLPSESVDSPAASTRTPLSANETNKEQFGPTVNKSESEQVQIVADAPGYDFLAEFDDWLKTGSVDVVPNEEL
jgi:hypothetical protein